MPPRILVLTRRTTLLCAPSLQLITLLRKCKLRARLRAARERMHGLFPFNEQQWMDWINDEMDSLTEPEDVSRVRGLFEAAVEEYLSVTLWESYLE
jgi:squamous cell carcinoma antigen recognized by T-cells 3